MSEELFKISIATADEIVLRHAGQYFYLDVSSGTDGLTAFLTLPELKALHERLGEVLWDVSAGRIKVGEGEK